MLDDVDFAGGVIGLANGVAAALGTYGRKHVRLCTRGALVEADFNHLGDDVAGALHDDSIADADILAGDLVGVVTGGVGDDDAADGDRSEFGDRRQRAGAANLDLDVAKLGGGLFGRELVSDGPTRTARDEAKAVLQVEAIDFVDDAIDVVAEFRALLADLAVIGEQGIGGLTAAHEWISRQAPLGIGGDDAALRVGG